MAHLEMGTTGLETGPNLDAALAENPVGTTPKSEPPNGEIETDVQSLLTEMQTSFKSFSETVFAKSLCQATCDKLHPTRPCISSFEITDQCYIYLARL